MSEVSDCLCCIARPRYYVAEQWFALALSVACLSIDVWGAVTAIKVGWRGPLEFWLTEFALALAALSLLWFASSKYSRSGSAIVPVGRKVSFTKQGHA